MGQSAAVSTNTIINLSMQLLSTSIGAPKGIRTPVAAVKGPRPRPLDDRS